MPDSTPATAEQVSELISVYTDLKRYFENARDDFEQRITAKETQVDGFLKTIQAFHLSRGEKHTDPEKNTSKIIYWHAPDREKYTLTIPDTPPSNGWTVENDTKGTPVMALYQDPAKKKDARLELSLDGAVSDCASLFHDEDDFPRVYATATDGGNGVHIKRPAFIISQPGVKDCPIAIVSAFKVVCLKV